MPIEKNLSEFDPVSIGLLIELSFQYHCKYYMSVVLNGNKNCYSGYQRSQVTFKTTDYGSEMAETHPVLETVLGQNEDKDEEIQPTQDDPFPDKAEESPSEKQPCCQDMTLDGDDNQSSSAEKLSQENPTFILQDSNVNPITANITKMQEILRKSNKKIETLMRKLKTLQQRSQRLKKKFEDGTVKFQPILDSPSQHLML